MPQNVSTQTSASVRGLRTLGVDAKGLVVNYGTQTDDNSALEVHELRPGARAARARYAARVLRLVAWADVLHYHWGNPALPLQLDLKLARALRKPALVEFWGSDIRIAALEEIDNPWFAARGPSYENEGLETAELSYARQRVLSRHGVRTALTQHSAFRFILPDAFQQVIPNTFGLVMDELAEHPPTGKKPLRIAHSPSAPGVKGTAAVVAAVEAARQTCEFEFTLLQGLPRHEALEAVRECDVYLDQFVEGTTYGVAAVEAMAMGKPVVCYIKPQALQHLPEDLPVIVTDQAKLPDLIKSLAREPNQLISIGRASRQYALRQHDAVARARWLLGIYQELLPAAARSDLPPRQMEGSSTS